MATSPVARTVSAIVFGALAAGTALLGGCAVGDEDVDATEDALTVTPGPALGGDPARECPAPFNARKPVPGGNSGFTVAGQSRAFQLLLPPASFTGPRPILFAFHGTTENGQRFVNRARLAEWSAKGFIVVAPDAVGNGQLWPVWDAMRSPLESSANKDVELFDKLLACTAAHYAVDKTRIFATGHSAGGIFTNRLLRARSKVLAGGVVASGVFDLTGGGGAPDVLDPLTVIVTWGGDNDTYTGTTPSGVHVPSFSFVEQAALATQYYDEQRNVAHAYCRGGDVGHAWLAINAWFTDVLLARPKGTTGAFAPPPAPGVRCQTGAYALPPLPQVTCAATARDGCQAACQLIADCAVENRTIAPVLGSQLSAFGFSSTSSGTSCGGCVQTCERGATTAADARVLACLERHQDGAQCSGGIEGAAPMILAVNECCQGQTSSNLCKGLCRGMNANDSARVLFPACRQF